MTLEHGLAGIRPTSELGRPIVVCRCGCMAAGKPGVSWTVVVINGRASCSPSFDWKGHFHETAQNVPVVDWPANFRDALECAEIEAGTHA